jgi:hypothetical protein
MQAVDRRTFLRSATAAAGGAGALGGAGISRAFAQGAPVKLKFGTDLPATGAFQAALAKTSFYKDTKAKLGEEGWIILQKYAGNIG